MLEKRFVLEHEGGGLEAEIRVINGWLEGNQS